MLHLPGAAPVAEAAGIARASAGWVGRKAKSANEVITDFGTQKTAIPLITEPNCNLTTNPEKPFYQERRNFNTGPPENLLIKWRSHTGCGFNLSSDIDVVAAGLAIEEICRAKDFFHGGRNLSVCTSV